MHFNKGLVHGIKWTSFSAIIGNIVGVLQISILARLLEKSDFGLMAIVGVVIGFSDIFIDIGVSNAIIYKQEITREQLSTLYWVNAIIGIVFFGIIFIIAYPVSVFYHSPELKPLLSLMAITFLVKPWGQQHMVLMQKNLQFDRLAIIEIVSRIIAFCFTVLAAYFGMRVYSLAVGQIALSIISSVGYIIKSDAAMRPLFYFNMKEIRHEVRFGLYQLGEKVLNYFSSQFDTILIGRLLGMDMLGLYNMANVLAGKVFYLINPIVSKVTFPIMARLNNDIDQLNKYHLMKVKYIGYIAIPIYTFFFTLSVPVVHVLLGNQWLNAAGIFSLFSLGYIIICIGNPNGVLLLSVGKAKESFCWNLYSVIVYPLSLIIGSFYGLYGIIYTALSVRLFNYFIAIHFLVKPLSGITINSNLSVLTRPVIFSILCALITYISTYYIDSYLISLSVGGLVYFTIFVFLVKLYDSTTVNQLLQFMKAV